MKRHTLLITGGHPTPALAVIDEYQRTHKDVDLIFAGRKYVNQNESSHSYEFDEVQKRKVTYIPVAFDRGWRGLVTFLTSCMTAFNILSAHRPDALLSFGGYIALPFVCAARLQSVPIFTHEQTAVMGTANRIIALFAQKVFLSFPKQNLDKSKYVFTGNPIRSQICHPSSDTPMLLPTHKPILLITGGNLGSHSINMLIFPLLSKLVKIFTVVHQTGNIQSYGDVERSCQAKLELPADDRESYIPMSHLPSDMWGSVLARSALVVSRSGANTFFELIATQKPSVLIPLPWSAFDEQQKHAQMLVDAGVAEICDQSSGSPKLLETIMRVYDNRSKYAAKYPTLQHLYVPDAAHFIVQSIVFS